MILLKNKCWMENDLNSRFVLGAMNAMNNSKEMHISPARMSSLNSEGKKSNLSLSKNLKVIKEEFKDESLLADENED